MHKTPSEFEKMKKNEFDYFLITLNSSNRFEIINKNILYNVSTFSLKVITLREVPYY